MRRVQQEDADGCGVAVLAMLLDLTYVEAKVLLAVPYVKGHIHHGHLDEALLNAGRAVGTRWRHDPLLGGPRPVWPLAPFAPQHYVIVRVAAGYHVVAMTADGMVLDPHDPCRTSLVHPDYLDIDQIVGVWRIDVQEYIGVRVLTQG